MLKHHIKFAFRNFKSNKIIFGGSLLTICLGALSVSLLALFLHNEFTRNDFHKREKDIYLTVVKSSPESQWENAQPSLFFGFNYTDYPEIEAATAVQKYKEGDMYITYGQKTQYPEGIVVDSTFFKVFDFSLKIGNEKTVLSDPNAILLSESLAKKLFNNDNPIGKTVTIGTYMEDKHIVKGILDKIPSNSSMAFDFVIPNSYVPNQFMSSGIEFLLLKKGVDINVLSKKIEHLGDGHNQFKESLLGLVPFTSIYFNETNVDFGSVFSSYGNKDSLYVLIIILMVILVISAMNISNLQIINTNTSVKMIVLSVINGAQKRHVLYQKVTELTLLVLLSVLLITLVQYSILPNFNNFTQVPLRPSLGMLASLNALIVVVIASFALIYPIIIALKIPIAKSLKGQSFFISKLTGKKGVVIAQYALTFILLISSIIVVKQLNLMLNKDLGFVNDDIIKTKLFYEIPTPMSFFDQVKDDDPQKIQQRNQSIKDYEARRNAQKSTYEFIKNELRANALIAGFSQGSSPLEVFKGPWKLNNKGTEFLNHNTLAFSEGHKKIFDFELVEGRFFDEKKDAALGNKIILNETAKKYWGITDISKSSLHNKYWNDGAFEVVGIIKDFNYERLSFKPQPLVMVCFETWEDDNFLIRFKKGTTAQGLQFVEKLFHKANPNKTFEYTFLTDEIAEMYQKEKQLSTFYIIFTALALIISTIGLFTIALYDTQRRVKEIGIRKVNGAKTREVLAMLNKDFSRHVVYAFIIACPIAYFSMQKWLEDFAYKTAISWWIFLAAGVFTLIIALLTVSWHSYRAAVANPVQSLRTE